MVQEKIISHVEPIKIRLNTNQLDPDYVPKSIDREPNQDVATGKDLKVKNDTKKQAKVISSLKSLKKLQGCQKFGTSIYTKKNTILRLLFLKDTLNISLLKMRSFWNALYL